MAMTIVEAARPVTGGVDTHLDVHVAAALDPVGGLLGVESFAATRAGFAQLLGWMTTFGPVRLVGVEGTGSYGAGLARHLTGAGIEVVEVDRPDRQARRRNGKSDPNDAIEAARAALSGRASGVAKTRVGVVEAIRVLLVAKRSARSMRAKTIVQRRPVGDDGLMDQLAVNLQVLEVAIAWHPQAVSLADLLLETDSPNPAPRDQVEAALRRLFSTGVLEPVGSDSLRLSATGISVARSLGRSRGARRSAKLAEAIEQLPTIRSPRFDLEPAVWDVAMTARARFRRDKLIARLEIVSALQKALRMMDEIDAVVRKSPDREAAVAALARPPFSFVPIQAHHILDLTVGRQTELGRSQIDEEVRHLTDALAALEAEGDPEP
jgi:hypothetical protein